MGRVSSRVALSLREPMLECNIWWSHSYLRDWLGNLAVKTMMLQFMLEGPRPCTVLCFNVHTTVEYLNKNVSIGQLLQHIPNTIVVCVGSRPKRQTKTYNKDVCQVS